MATSTQTHYDLPELLYGNFVNPIPGYVRPLVDYVTELSP